MGQIELASALPNSLQALSLCYLLAFAQEAVPLITGA